MSMKIKVIFFLIKKGQKSGGENLNKFKNILNEQQHNNSNINDQQDSKKKPEKGLSNNLKKQINSKKNNQEILLKNYQVIKYF